jgi:hypothetical protein
MRTGVRPEIQAALTSLARTQAAGQWVIPALLLVCASITTAAAQSAAPQPLDVLDEVVVANEHERERQPSPTVSARNPDVIAITRGTKTLIEIQPYIPASAIRFRRDSAARQLIETPGTLAKLARNSLVVEGRQLMRVARIELATNIGEEDGLPAQIQFGPHSSLVNIDYVRLNGTNRQTKIGVRNVLDPQTRRCENHGAWSDDGLPFSSRFLFISDEFRTCRSALQGRHGDLFVAEGVPEKLQQDLFEIYDPISAGFSSRLGSEPGLVYVAWWPESLRTDARFEPSWNRSALLLFNGLGWQDGITPAQRNLLRDSFTRDQIQRRIREADWPGFFTTSAAGYLLLLARSEYDGNTNRRLAADLPIWISRCANRLDGRVFNTNFQPDVPGNDCGRLLQFVFDAVARAAPDGHRTAYDTWRKLLKDANRSGKAGVTPSAFLASSADARRIAQGLLQGSMDWQRFAIELDKFGVKLQIKQDQLGVTAQVVSLQHFHNAMN